MKEFSYRSENFVVDQCTQRHNKKYQPTYLDVFDKNWHALVFCMFLIVFYYTLLYFTILYSSVLQYTEK